MKYIGDPNLLMDISYEMCKLINDNDIVIAAIGEGLPFACIISQIKKVPLILVKNKNKNKIFENKNKIVLIIKSKKKISNILDIIKSKKYNIKLLLLDEILEKIFEKFNKNKIRSEIQLNNNLIIKLMAIIKQKKSNLIVSLDLENPEILLDKLNLLSEHICGVKLHIDIINFSTYDKNSFITNLKILSRDKNFLIIEDRKYADIPYISLQQYNNIAYADIITIHGICGESLIEELNKKDIGILLIHQLSTKNNLIDRIYSNKVRDIGLKYNNIVGFISQEKVLSNYLTFSPAINLDTNSDTMGQQYKSINSRSDIFIVGRGIYEKDNIVETAKKYKELCFHHWIY